MQNEENGLNNGFSSYYSFVKSKGNQGHGHLQTGGVLQIIMT